MRTPELTDDAVIRFFRFVVVSDECFGWRGAKHGQGYGLFQIGRSSMRANRVAYRIYHGEWPKGLVLHICNTPECVKKSHLYEGNYSDNMIDRATAGVGFKNSRRKKEVS